ncbi:hypothetical protein MVEN_01188000 [Mycena venus]|uniref:Uncharacterized protein n=1 Tax=Mycena venus TaxID=2733690 RepID=A0A8H6Y4V2_9AGAR|nr:hypothetical protein MVEN_01188000 [Mycena venus]
MSIRPFSPTESFAFPTPPRENRSSAWTMEATTPMPSDTSMLLPEITKMLVPSPPQNTNYRENPFADAFSIPITAAASRKCERDRAASGLGPPPLPFPSLPVDDAYGATRKPPTTSRNHLPTRPAGLGPLRQAGPPRACLCCHP